MSWTDAYFGRYRSTPFGVHLDGASNFTFGVSGYKTFYLWEPDYFRVEGYRVTTYHRAPPEGATKATIDTEATVKLWVGDERLIAVGEGNGPVNALDQALRRVLVGAYPRLAHIHLTDYRVRILDGVADTDAVVRVLIDSTDGELAWTTIGVSTNIIEASWQALTDGLIWGLLHSGQ